MEFVRSGKLLQQVDCELSEKKRAMLRMTWQSATDKSLPLFVPAINNRAAPETSWFISLMVNKADTLDWSASEF